MAAGPILMPKLGLTMTEGSIAEWCVKPGDEVRAGDTLFIVETDKIANEIEASDAGVIGDILVPAGESALVGAVVATYRGGDAATGEAAAPSPALAQAPAAPPAQASHTVGNAEPRIVATPLARRLAAQSGSDLRSITGSGPRGRIMARDIPAAAPPSAAAAEAAPTPSPDRMVALTENQRIVARRLSESKRDIPHFYAFIDADIAALTRLRRELNGDPAGPRLSVTHFLIAAAAKALGQVPELNRLWAEDHLLQLDTVDIGLAVDTDKGLFAPVLHDIGALALDDIAQRAEALVGRARLGRLTREDLSGGVLSISNVGMFGATGLIPIVNPGQSTILGVGAARPVFRPDESGAPRLCEELQLSIACDHRVVNGAAAARFLDALRTFLENPIRLVRPPKQDR